MPLPSLFPLMARGALDLLYPPLCLSCGGRSDGGKEPFLCPACAARIAWIEEDRCMKCGAPQGPYAGGRGDCRDCRGADFSFTTARGAVRYAEPVTALVHALKFGGHRMVAERLGELLVRMAREFGFPGEPVDLVVPVPLHRWRRFLRGFNQAELIARPLARALGVPLDARAVKRKRNTPPQASLSGRQRRRNPEGAFIPRKGLDLEGRRVLLVDDVMTTGRTASACAAALREAGAARIYVATAAR